MDTLNKTSPIWTPTDGGTGSNGTTLIYTSPVTTQNVGTMNLSQGNSTTGDGSPYDMITETDMVLVIVIFSSIGMLGVIFNIVSLLILKSGKYSNKSTRIQLLNQAANDLLMSIICPPRFIVRELVIPWPNSPALCKIVVFSSETVFMSSVIWNAAISIERFIAVFFPLRMLSYTSKQKTIVAAVVWCVAIAINIDNFVFYTIVDRYSRPQCLSTNPLKQNHPVRYQVLDALPYIILSLTIIVMYTCVGLKLLFRRYVRHPERHEEDPTDQTEKVVKMLAADAVVTLFTWMGTYLSYTIIKALGVELTLRQRFTLSQAFNGIVLSNCFTTPLVYFIFNRGYRADVRRSIKRGFRSERPTSVYYDSAVHKTSVARQLSLPPDNNNRRRTSRQLSVNIKIEESVEE